MNRFQDFIGGGRWSMFTVDCLGQLLSKTVNCEHRTKYREQYHYTNINTKHLTSAKLILNSCL